MAETECRRVHISGLNTTQCSVQDLRSRFESFQLHIKGEIHNWPPGVDAVGNVQNWCFVTLEGEAAKIKRAIQVLHNTVWKGSKLRIGNAREQMWDGGLLRSSVTKADTVPKAKEDGEKGKEEERDKEEKKQKKKCRRIESSSIDHPVEAKDVEEGLWGWKKTPAGHLIKPIHVRPDRPLPKPSSRPADASKENDKGRSKRSTKGAKPPSRAKRVTLDPSRYGSVHLSSVVLDDGSDGLPKGYEWVCEETDSGAIEWNLKDAQGEVVKTERVQVQKALPQPFEAREERIGGDDAIEDDDSDDEDDDDDDDDDDSMMSDVGAAIENASSLSSSSESAEEEQQKVSQPRLDLAAAKLVKDDYDPAEESDFSEGYQEMQAEAAPHRKDWKEEKLDQIALLKKMFGELPSEESGPSNQHESVASSDSENEEEVEREERPDVSMISEPAAASSPDVPLTGAQKRAALLKALTPSAAGAKSFKPVVRFDPGSASQKDERDDEAVEMSVDSIDANEPTTATAGAVEMEEEEGGKDIPTVQMASLKDMFRPKEDTGGFSLLGDLDLELEAETAEEYEEEWEQEAEPPTRAAAQSSVPLPLPSQTRKAPMFFPTSTAAGGESWLDLLQKDRTVPPFCRDQSDEEIQAIWKERKGTLTQEYKRRHREALKKKKRKYTGARAAGTAMAG